MHADPLTLSGTRFARAIPNPISAGAAPNRRLLLIDDNPAIHGDFRKVLCAAAPDDFDAEEARLPGEASSTGGEAAFEIDSEKWSLEQQARWQLAVLRSRLDLNPAGAPSRQHVRLHSSSVRMFFP
jgi:hypothetical protein